MKERLVARTAEVQQLEVDLVVFELQGQIPIQLAEVQVRSEGRYHRTTTIRIF